MSLIDYWPFETFRQGQQEVLEQIENSWDNHDVIVCRLPTSWGKTPLSVAIQNWQLDQSNSTAITVPNNMLRDQNIKDWPHLKTVKAMEDYWIESYNMTEKEFRQRIYKWGPKNSEYNRDRQEAKRVGSPICVNYYSYIAHKLQRNVVIVDEAHLLLKTLQDFSARKLWFHKYRYPNNIRSLHEVKQWVDTLPDSRPIKQLKDELNSLTPATLIERGQELYKGDYRACLKLIPLSVENAAPIFWPKKTSKIVLISATLGEEDVIRMGLGTRRIKWIDTQSPIPAERRAVIPNFVGNMSFASQDSNIPALIERIKQIRESNEGNGFVHASYSLAAKLKRHLNEPWAVYHGRDREDKQRAYDQFAATDPSERKVMIGSGMSDGINMCEDIARWQIIAKVPYPSLAEPAMRWVAKNQPEYYNWMVAREIMQSCGRVCRSPEDYGITIILDSCFIKWYNRSKHTLPSWFVDAVQGMEEYENNTKGE